MSKFPFDNGLTDAQSEVLALIAEEAGELVQVVGKILRHGLHSKWPLDGPGPTNMEMLEHELGDLKAAVNLLLSHDLARGPAIEEAAVAKLNRLPQFLHHAKVP